MIRLGVFNELAIWLCMTKYILCIRRPKSGVAQLEWIRRNAVWEIVVTWPCVQVWKGRYLHSRCLPYVNERFHNGASWGRLDPPPGATPSHTSYPVPHTSVSEYFHYSMLCTLVHLSEAIFPNQPGDYGLHNLWEYLAYGGSIVSRGILVGGAVLTIEIFLFKVCWKAGVNLWSPGFFSCIIQWEFC